MMADMLRLRSPRLTVIATAATLIVVAAIAGVTVFASLSNYTRQRGGDPGRDVIVNAKTCETDSVLLQLSQGTERVEVLGNQPNGCSVRLTVTVSGSENRFNCTFPAMMGDVLVATNRSDYTSDISPTVMQLRPEDRNLYCTAL